MRPEPTFLQKQAALQCVQLLTMSVGPAETGLVMKKAACVSRFDLRPSRRMLRFFARHEAFWGAPCGGGYLSGWLPSLGPLGRSPSRPCLAVLQQRGRLMLTRNRKNRGGWSAF